MARNALLLVGLLVISGALAGCVQSTETHHHHSYEDDGCWMFCSSESYEYNAFIWFPMMFVVLLVMILVIAVVAGQNNQQTVVVREKEKD